MNRRIAFAVGDTAGHVKPALAILEAFRLLPGSVEASLVTARVFDERHVRGAAGITRLSIPASALARAGPVSRAGAIALVASGVRHARRLLRRTGARLVIGTGGYTSGAVVLAARSLGLVTALVEPNTTPGLANRLLRRWVDRAYVSWDDCARGFAGKALVTGTPVLPSLAARLGRVRVPPSVGMPVNILVTGASRGEHYLGSQVPPLLGIVQARGVPLRVLHQAGTLAAPDLKRAYEQAGVTATATPHIEDMAEAYDWAHFVIGRAGANTLAELAIAGLPALVVPLGDAAADHQASNAAAYARGGAALWCREETADREQLAVAIAGVLGDPQRWATMSEAARALARPHAAHAVVADCERLMEGRW